MTNRPRTSLACEAKELSPALQRWVHGPRRPSAVGTAEHDCAVPTGLGFNSNFYPALKRWAKLFRAYGARFPEQDRQKSFSQIDAGSAVGLNYLCANKNFTTGAPRPQRDFWGINSVLSVLSVFCVANSL